MLQPNMRLSIAGDVVPTIAAVGSQRMGTESTVLVDSTRRSYGAKLGLTARRASI